MGHEIAFIVTHVRGVQRKHLEPRLRRYDHDKEGLEALDGHRLALGLRGDCLRLPGNRLLGIARDCLGYRSTRLRGIAALLRLLQLDSCIFRDHSSRTKRLPSSDVAGVVEYGLEHGGC